MATKHPSPVSTPLIAMETSSLDELKEQNAHLQSELEAERKQIKQLRREKSYEVQQTRELEQTKASVALKDLRSKLHAERIQEHQLLKDSLNRKADGDLQKVTRQRDSELTKLRTDLQRCQDELVQTREQLTNHNSRGLSGTSARATFDSERQKLLTEVQDLRTARRRLESELKAAVEAERQRAAEVQHVRDTMKAEMVKAQREADSEMKRLLEELKSKDRLLRRENGSRSDYSAAPLRPDYGAATKLLLETPPVSPVSSITEETPSAEKDTNWTIHSAAKSSSDSGPSQNTNNPPKKETSAATHVKVKELKELRTRIKELEDQSSSLGQDKTKLQQKIKEMERKHRTTQEKNKRFLEKNIDVTNVNRSLEEKIKKLNDELNKLRSVSEKWKKEQNKLNEQLNTEKIDRSSMVALTGELDDLKQQAEEHEKTITALKMACTEKDRRIELLVHRRRKKKKVPTATLR